MTKHNLQAIAVLLAVVLSNSAAIAQTAVVKRDLAQEERNRTLVLNFSEAVFNKHDLSVSETMLAEDYRQHNPRFPDGRAAFIAMYKKLIAADPGAHSEIVRSATDGDLVWVHIRAINGAGKPSMAILNIFRVRDSKITEHWDILQPVPDTSANNNTMF